MDKYTVQEELIARWEGTKFLSGIDSADVFSRNLMSVCLENAQHEIDRMEASDEPVGKFKRWALPLTRRVIHDLAMRDLVSFQPLTQPDGKVFFLNFLYPANYNALTAGENVADGLDKTYTSSGMNTKGVTARKVRLSLTSAAVSATSKKIVGEMYIEDEQDLQTYYGLAGETQLLQAMATQVIREVNLRIISDLVTNASAGNTNFDVTLPTTGVYSTVDPKIYKRKLWESIIDADAQVFAKRFVTPNWIIAGADACAYLEKLEEFKSDNKVNQNQLQTGLYRFGTLSQRWTVYKYAYMPTLAGSKIMLVGYKGSNEFDTGYVYAPYIPVYITPPLTDSETFKKSRGLMNRSAEHLVSGDFYSTVTLQNL